MWQVVPPLVHVCRLYTTRAACDGEELPTPWYKESIAESVEERGLMQGVWPCKWHDDADFTSYSPCWDDNCRVANRLYVSQFSIVAEFNALYFWATTLIGVIMLAEKVDLWDHVNGYANFEA